MTCPNVRTSAHGVMLCARNRGHAPPCQWRRKHQDEPCPTCGPACELDPPPSVERMSNERARQVEALVLGDEEGNGILPVMEGGYACEPGAEALAAFQELGDDWLRARAEEARLREELEKASGSEARYVAELTRLRETLAAEAEELRKERDVALARAVMAEQTRDGLAEENGRLRSALEGVEAALGDRLLAKGPLSEPYAHSVMRAITKALK